MVVNFNFMVSFTYDGEINISTASRGVLVWHASFRCIVFIAASHEIISWLALNRYPRYVIKTAYVHFNIIIICWSWFLRLPDIISHHCRYMGNYYSMLSSQQCEMSHWNHISSSLMPGSATILMCRSHHIVGQATFLCMRRWPSWTLIWNGYCGGALHWGSRANRPFLSMIIMNLWAFASNIILSI